jgi:hypothetical protein
VQCENIAALQSTYTLHHPALGHHHLLLSPNDARGEILEAVFNRV